MKVEYLLIGDPSNISEIEISDDLFAGKVSDHVIYECVKAFNANQRLGLATVKGRSDVSMTGAKPYRQKGTGRARMGSKKSPLLRGGGVMFGPQKRSFHIGLSKKIKVAGYRSLFSKKALAGDLKIIDKVESSDGKTKEFDGLMSKVSKTKKVLLVVDGNSMVKRAAKNLTWLRCFDAERLSYKDMFYADEVILTKVALEKIEKKYGRK